MMRLGVAVCGAFLVDIPAAQLSTLKPNTHWLAEDGSKIEAHGAGLLQSPVDGRWYWYGESAKVHVPNNESAVNCYSGDTLSGPWRFEGEVLSQPDIKVDGWTGPWIMERPKVLFNNKTKKYVMWFHLDQPSSWPEEFSLIQTQPSMDTNEGTYVFKKAAVATADSPAGPFTFLDAFDPDGEYSMDMNLFQDPLDGKAYFIRHCARGVCISEMTEDYLNTTGIATTLPEHVEGTAMFRLSNGTFYILSSHLTGWKPNPMIAFRSKGTELKDVEWEDIGNPTADATSFDSQPTFIVQYQPKKGDPYFVYMGDNWVKCGLPDPDGPRAMLKKACYVWLPIKLDGANGPLHIEYKEEWDMEDPWAIAPGQSLRGIGRHVGRLRRNEVQWN